MFIGSKSLFELSGYAPDETLTNPAGIEFKPILEDSPRS